MPAQLDSLPDVSTYVERTAWLTQLAEKELRELQEHNKVIASYIRVPVQDEGVVIPLVRSASGSD